MTDRTWTPAEEREIGKEMSRNPILKVLCEAIVLYQTHGSLEGFSAGNGYVKQHLGEEAARRWQEIASRIVAALQQ